MNKSVFRMHRYYILNTAIIGMILCIYFLTASTDIHSVMGRAGVSPFYKGDTSRRQVALSVHVDTEDSAMVLEVADNLRRSGTPATFFIHREFAAAHQETVETLADNGFEIGSLGPEGTNPVGRDPGKVRSDLIATEQQIMECTNKPLDLYCPQGGEYSRETLDVAASLGYKTVLWSVDAGVPPAKDAADIFGRATQTLYNGAIIRLTVSNAAVEALPEIVAAIEEKDYVFKTVGTLIQ